MDADSTPAPGRLGQLRQQYRKTPAYLALLLGLFSLVGAALLTMGQNMTSAAIAERQKEDLLTSLELVMPRALYDNDPVADSYVLVDASGAPHTIYPARAKGRISASAYQVTGQGYGGSIVIVMGVDRDGRIIGVRVLLHAETPGLGDKIEAGRGNWINGFTGLRLGEPPAEQWAVKKDGGRFDQFSGATITPRAVVKAVKGGLEFFNANRDRLLSLAPGGSS